MFSQVVVSSLLLAASVNGVMGIQYKREPNWFQLRDSKFVRGIVGLCRVLKVDVYPCRSSSGGFDS